MDIDQAVKAADEMGLLVIKRDDEIEVIGPNEFQWRRLNSMHWGFLNELKAPSPIVHHPE